MRINSSLQANYLNSAIQNDKPTDKRYISSDTVNFQAKIKPQHIFQKAINAIKLHKEWNRYIKQEANWNLINEYADKLNDSSYKGIKRAKEIMDYVPERFRILFDEKANEINGFENPITK